ncbi:hypothetical protein V5799_007470 [Amblyomma americanum]|uniref:SP-RING-type domain-containing protein n=1 Tax=Amblyomma americanum TaxID=6943 RepID=A0AAQ4FFT3_AMBAM
MFVHFAFNSGQTAARGCTARLIIGGKVYYGLPFTMVNITQVLYTVPKKQFLLRLEAIPRHVSVHLDEVMRTPENDLLQKIQESEKYVYKREDTLALVKDCLTTENRGTVQGLQIHIPCRGVHCRHVQCFDAYAYLGCYEATLEPSWSCAVCFDQVLVQDLRVDLFTLDILSKTDDHCIAVVVQADGRWGFVKSDNDLCATGVHDNSPEAEAFPYHERTLQGIIVESESNQK